MVYLTEIQINHPIPLKKLMLDMKGNIKMTVCGYQESGFVYCPSLIILFVVREISSIGLKKFNSLAIHVNVRLNCDMMKSNQELYY